MGRDDALLKAFADELRAQRKLREISQEELAHRASVNRTYVAKLELAQNQPTLTVLNRLASALELDLTDLVAATLQRYRLETKSDVGRGCHGTG
jgi:transcriptional regulator with XRE-family HTH domain